MRVFKIFFLLLIALIIPLPASAHLAGQPPFFKVNGKYSNFYPAPLLSAHFEVPQDLAPENYLVNQPLEFEIDVKMLPVPPEIVEKTEFGWDFGDGTKGKGVKYSHTYTKAGSYILTIDAKYQDTQSIQQTPSSTLLQSILLQVLPDQNYHLPKPQIKINNRLNKDPVTDIYYIPYGQELAFDASASLAGSKKITEYIWDFGDGQSDKNAVTKHTYSLNLDQQQIFPILRIKDENGFISDTYVEISNEEEPSIGSIVSSDKTGRNYLIATIVIVLIAMPLIYWFTKKGKK